MRTVQKPPCSGIPSSLPSTPHPRAPGDCFLAHANPTEGRTLVQRRLDYRAGRMSVAGGGFLPRGGRTYLVPSRKNQIDPPVPCCPSMASPFPGFPQHCASAHTPSASYFLLLRLTRRQDDMTAVCVQLAPCIGLTLSVWVFPCGLLEDRDITGLASRGLGLQPYSAAHRSWSTREVSVPSGPYLCFLHW